jgi:hypothetical protein
MLQNVYSRKFIPSLPPRHQLGLLLEVHSAISFMEAPMTLKTDRLEDNGNDLDQLAMTAEQPMGVPPGALETAVSAAAADRADDREDADDQPDDEDESEDEEEGEEAKGDSPTR